MRRTLHEQVAANKNASVLYGMLLVLLLAALGAVIAGYYEPSAWPLGGAAAAVLGLILAMVAWFGGPGIVLSISHAREATALEHRTLNNVAEEMAIAAGIPVPKVMVIDDSAPNAFATGRDPRTGVVVFTTGIIEKLDRDELQGVMAHEIAHIRNYDIRFMTSIALIAGVIPLIADMFWRAQWYGGGRRRSSDRDGGGQAIFLILAIVLVVLAPIFAKMLELAVSRKREYLADATAAELTRNPEGLASALMKITNDPEPLEAANRATQHLYIVNPLKSYEARMSSLFSTHPPIEERVKALRNIMGVVERPPLSDR